MPVHSFVDNGIGAERGADIERIQGVWKCMAGRRNARLLVAGNRFTFEFTDGDIYMGFFELDDHFEPRRMDMHIEEGPAEHRGQVACCIYHLESDVLCWCPSKPGSEKRLTSFPSLDDDRYLSLVFKQARPARNQ